MSETKKIRRLSHCSQNVGSECTLQPPAIWKKRSSFLNNSSNNLFQGLITMTKKQSSTCHQPNSNVPEHIPPLQFQLNIGQNEQSNPFQMTKAKLKIRNQQNSLKTSASSQKESRQVLQEVKQGDPNTDCEDVRTITMKKVNERERGRKKEALRSLTDR